MSKKVHILTDPEKMIWAAVFARESDLHNPPSRCCKPTEEAREAWAKWEKERIHMAAEIASTAVEHLREQREALVDGNKGFATASFVNQMVVWI